MADFCPSDRSFANGVESDTQLRDLVIDVESKLEYVGCDGGRSHSSSALVTILPVVYADQRLLSPVRASQ
jgi:hypothetical protein